MDVIVIGGGASGLFSAIFAAKSNNKVTIIECDKNVGTKINITGNGKCNLTNLNMNSTKYYGNAEFIDNVLAQFNEKDTINFFENLGVMIYENNGYVYPLSNQATTISNILRDYATELGVKIKTNNVINSVKKINKKFHVDIGTDLECDKLIIATGGLSGVNNEYSKLGYKIASDFGHKIVTLKPALTSLVCEKSSLNSAAGVRVVSNVTIHINKKITSEKGEIQITNYGVSGIPIFNISSMCEKGTKLEIDFMPDYNSDMIYKIISGQNGSIGKIISRFLNEKLALAILDKVHINKNINVKDLDSNTILNIINKIKFFDLIVIKNGGYNHSQVTKGGVCTFEIDPNSMESRLVPGLYFAGEIIDVDGMCGGYNLQFAWSTGYIAGRDF